jgi:hypothetical protein
MSDLIERARGLGKTGYPPLAILGELADEIERLQSAATEDIAEIAKREKEISELRAILAETYHEAFEHLHPDTAKKARAALEQKEQGRS